MKQETQAYLFDAKFESQKMLFSGCGSSYSIRTGLPVSEEYL